MNRKLATLLAIAILGGGCAIPPKRVRIEVEPPAQWSAASPQTPPETAELKTWWKTFQDPTLDSLVERALTSNFDLKLAAARIREARGARGVTAAARYPAINQTDSFQRIRGGFAQGVTRVGSSGGGTLVTPFETNNFQIGFDATWEIDVFGGVRNSVNAAQADVNVAIESQRDVLVSLLGELARTYVELRGLQRRVAVVQKNIAVQQETVHLTKVRSQAGLATELDVSRAEAQLATTEAVLPQLEATMAQAIHRLGVLTGQTPGALIAELTPVEPVPSRPPSVPVGMPADLLRRRPDIRRAEAEIVAATARLQVAQAERFPKFSLTGSFGRQATSVSGFTLGAGNFFAIGPGIRLPIFTGGRIKSNIEIQDARLEQCALQYQQTLLIALEETENALVAYAHEEARRQKLVAAVQSSQQAAEFANELYVRGLSDFLSVLAAQQTQYTAEDELAQSETSTVESAVRLYKALGGGW
ncbi:MAG TPA: efflux transporter outer membrane subunit [Acidobacteriota bacterium]|nr:efflux transporter outer membrane subunit [Acidobacteriota bacterium]HND19590.1 efflux transporter outer membrane subunit [Acidobacteriota bacterium]